MRFDRHLGQAKFPRDFSRLKMIGDPGQTQPFLGRELVYQSHGTHNLCHWN